MRTISKNVPVGDIEIACTIVGEGTPVVVLHGAIGLGSNYMRALDPWGEELQLVLYDRAAVATGVCASCSRRNDARDTTSWRRSTLALHRVSSRPDPGCSR